MSNIDNIIKDIEDVNMNGNFWIRDSNGQLKDGVICAEIIPFLKELKDYEIDFCQDEVMRLCNEAWELDNVTWGNSYNWSSPIDHDFQYGIMRNEDESVTFFISVHRFGDVRGNYTDTAMCHFDNEYELWELESALQCITINDRFCADLNIWFETYDVYDYETNESLGGFYQIDKDELLEEINERLTTQ